MTPRKTIIFLHGLRGTHHGLTGLAKELKEIGYDVIVPDLPGSGKSEDIAEKNLDTYAEWIHNFIASLNLPTKPVIAGHSMGSIIVSHFAENYPEDVDEKLILMSPIFRTKVGQAGSNATYKLIRRYMDGLDPDRRLEILKSDTLSMGISHYLTVDHQQQDRIDELHYKNAEYINSSESLLADTRISMREQTIIPAKKQVLILIGARDRLTSARYAAKRSFECENTVFEVVGGTGHLINYEKPKTVARRIDKFLADAS